jgi:hypothetical protein
MMDSQIETAVVEMEGENGVKGPEKKVAGPTRKKIVVVGLGMVGISFM